MMRYALCGCEPTPADVDGIITICTDGVSEHLLTSDGLAVITAAPTTQERLAS